MSHLSPWTEQEKDFIRENYKNMTDEEIGSVLDRTAAAVGSKRRSLDLKKAVPNGSDKAPVNGLMNKYVQAANSRGRKFDLPRDYFGFLIKQHCYYCGSEPSNVFDNSQYRNTVTYNGIDRVDNAKGYTKDNCVACCRACNFTKGKMDANDFIQHCRKVADHN